MAEKPQNTIVREITGKVITEIYPKTDDPEFKEVRTRRMFKIKPKKEKVIYVVYPDCPKLYKNDVVTIEGIFNRNDKFDFFDAYKLTVNDKLQDQKTGVIEFLRHQRCGVGAKRAAELYDIFGDDLMRVIQERPEQLEPYLPANVYDNLVGALSKFTPEKTEAFTFMLEHGLSILFSNRIYRKYSEKSIEMIKRDPYALTDTITNFTFKKAEDIAESIGLDKNFPSRLEYGIIDYLDNENDTNTFQEKETLALKMTTYLKGAEEIPIKKAINRMIKSKKLRKETFQGKEYIYTARLWEAESNTAAKLLQIIDNPCAIKISNVEFNRIIQKYNLDEDQIKALKMVRDNNISIITGGPGTGKTTLLKAITELIEATGTKPCILCAPTGKAAKMMQKNTMMEANTIHKTLGFHYDSGFEYNAKNKLKCKTLSVDESSMINIKLMEDMITAVDDNIKIVIMGDKDQLPAIGAGNVLKDCIESGKIPYTVLTHIHRRNADDLISVNAAHILHNEELETGENFVIDEANSATEISQKIIQYAAQMDQEKDQILVPMKKYENGTEKLNERIQQAINKNTKQFKAYNQMYVLGDKVMQTWNDYERGVMNGEWGFITDIDPVARTLTVTFNSDFSGKVNEVEYDDESIYFLKPAYVCTIHKTQGCEYDTVYIGVARSSGFMDMFNRNMLYTAVTRAKSKVVLIGDRTTIRQCISNASNDDRLSFLKERLCNQL